MAEGIEKQIEIDRGTLTRKLGMGAPIRKNLVGKNGKEISQRSQVLGHIKSAMSKSITDIDVIESVSQAYQGPLTAAFIAANFGATINMLQPGPPPVGAEFSTTFAEIGKFQVTTIVLATQWRLEALPYVGVQKCVSVATTASAGSKPVAPDAFSDQLNSSGVGDLATNGSLGFGSSQSGAGAARRALVMAGTWTDLAFFYMAKAYNFYGQYGNRTLWDNFSARHILSQPSGSQKDSASSSEMDMYAILREMNTYYQSSIIGATTQALVIDAARTGNQSLGGTAGLSTFRETGAYRTMAVTYGGPATRAMLAGNTDFMKHKQPRLYKFGVPIGARLQQVSGFNQGQMAKWLDVNHALGGAGAADFTESPNISTGLGLTGANGTTRVEPSNDASGSVANSIGIYADHVLYKFGTWGMTLSFKGMECVGEIADALKTRDCRDYCKNQTGMLLGDTEY